MLRLYRVIQQSSLTHALNMAKSIGKKHFVVTFKCVVIPNFENVTVFVNVGLHCRKLQHVLFR